MIRHWRCRIILPNKQKPDLEVVLLIIMEGAGTYWKSTEDFLSENMLEEVRYEIGDFRGI